MRIGRTLSAAVAASVAAAHGSVAETAVPDASLGWFAPAPQTCATPAMIELARRRIVTLAGVQLIAGVEWSGRFPRLARVSLQTVGGAGTEEAVIELDPDGQDLRVWFADRTSMTWRRCL